MTVQFSVDDLRSPESLERVLRQFQSAMNTPVPIPQTPPLNLSQIASSVIPLIQAALQAPGSSPLNLTALLPSAGTSAVFEDTHANRLVLYPAANYAVGTLFYETDRQILYAVASSSGTLYWQYVSGMMVAIFSARPTDLGSGDRGFLLFVTVQCHLMWWSGTAWFFLDGGGAYFQDFVATPPGSLGWQLCDGTATDYLVISGADLALTSFTTPDLKTTYLGTYRKSAAAYNATPNAAGMTGSVANATVISHTVTERLDVPGAGIFVFPSAADADHAVHNHAPGTLASEPRNQEVIVFFRR